MTPQPNIIAFDIGRQENAVLAKLDGSAVYVKQSLCGVPPMLIDICGMRQTRAARASYVRIEDAISFHEEDARFARDGGAWPRACAEALREALATVVLIAMGRSAEIGVNFEWAEPERSSEWVL